VEEFILLWHFDARHCILYNKRNKSNIQGTCNLSAQVLLFPLHDIILLSNPNMSTRDDIQLGTNECKMYHDGSIKLTLQVEILIVCAIPNYWIQMKKTEIHPGSA
jgi:hypothetical protein